MALDVTIIDEEETFEINVSPKLTKLSEKNERLFQTEYSKVSSRLNLNSDPDDFKHFYDYRFY